MKEQFVTYEIALKLKELGFDEKCFGYYTIMEDWMMKSKYSDNKLHFHGPNWANNDNTMRFMYVQNSFGDRDSTVKNSKFTKAIYNIAVPLWQQVIDWFNNKYGIFITLALVSNGYGFYIHKNYNTTNKGENYGFYPDIYKAREAAILKCIELCEQQNNY